MAHPFHHALSSVKRWGGRPEDYQPIHDWFDESKAHLADVRHRALRHHSEGIFLCEQIFGKTMTNSDGRVIPVRWVGEQHVQEDLGWIPTVKDWLEHMQLAPWMGRNGRLPLEDEERKKGAVNHGEEGEGEVTARGRKRRVAARQ
jgi:hypothetical protein